MTDPVTEAASKMFKVSIEQVTPEMRARAKTVTFASLYSTNKKILEISKGEKVKRDETEHKIWFTMLIFGLIAAAFVVAKLIELLWL
jgi:DNA polymerase I-like protein with 3'-5' exonuclease and polymerase domains